MSPLCGLKNGCLESFRTRSLENTRVLQSPHASSAEYSLSSSCYRSSPMGGNLLIMKSFPWCARSFVNNLEKNRTAISLRTTLFEIHYPSSFSTLSTLFLLLLMRVEVWKNVVLSPALIHSSRNFSSTIIPLGVEVHSRPTSLSFLTLEGHKCNFLLVPSVPLPDVPRFSSSF